MNPVNTNNRKIIMATDTSTNDKITVDQAITLSRNLREAARLVANYLYGDNWKTLNSQSRETLRSIEVTLQNVAADIVTRGVGINLKNSSSSSSIADLSKATNNAKKALKKINSVKQAISIVTSLIGLGAAIPTGNIEAIIGAAKAVEEAAKPLLT